VDTGSAVKEQAQTSAPDGERGVRSPMLSGPSADESALERLLARKIAVTAVSADAGEDVVAHLDEEAVTCGIGPTLDPGDYGWTCHDDRAAAAADGVLTTAEAPLGVLPPHTAALIHTGGAGARIPGVTLPHLPDSCFWTRRLVEVGRAIEVGPASSVSVETVRAALGRCVGQPALRAPGCLR
jgi:hypothetical protein